MVEQPEQNEQHSVQPSVLRDVIKYATHIYSVY
jgi:hypothetical protein